MKKIILLLITVISIFIFLEKPSALTGYTTGTDIMVRPAPNKDSGFIGQIKNENTVLDLVDDTLYNVNDQNCSIGWYKINYDNKEGYICGLFVSIGNQGDDNPNFNTEGYQARITDTLVSARRGAGYDTPSVAVLAPGTNLIILDKIMTPGSRCTAGWYHVKYYKNEEAYVCASYVNTKEELTGSDPSYEQELKNLGFPDSYIPYLVKLHSLHPNWNFKPVQTNHSWNTVVSNEQNKNFISSTYLNDPIKNIYQQGLSNEKGWYIATNEVNAFYLDPRNFLTEKFVFMFMDLKYNYGPNGKTTLNREDPITKEYYKGISGILGSSSYLNNDEHIYYFIEAGYEANVNPIYLVSLAKQEGTATDITDGSISGNYSQDYVDAYGRVYSLKGFYNYYNIRAFQSGENAPKTMGLAYACGEKCGFANTFNRPWDTREKAIKGGAKWIYEEYIGGIYNQNTIYFKKFNTNGSNPFTHQYQTNVTAPTGEAVSTYEAYQTIGLLENSFVFEIPIYNDMPETVSLPDVSSSNNNLTEIKVDGNLISGYSKDIYEYTVYVPNTYTSVKIEATKEDNGTTVLGLGNISLKETTTSHEIISVAENGNRKTYRLNIIKVEDKTTVDDILKNLSVLVNNEGIMYKISPGTTANTLIQSILKNSPKATVTIYNSSGAGITGGTLITTNSRIKIVAPSGDTKEFTLAVKGDVNGDGEITILDLLQVQKHLLNSTQLTGARLKAADTNDDALVTILDLLRVQKVILKELQF